MAEHRTVRPLLMGVVLVLAATALGASPGLGADEDDVAAAKAAGPQVPQGRTWETTVLDSRNSGLWSLTAWAGGFAALGTDPQRSRKDPASVWLSADGTDWELVSQPLDSAPSAWNVGHIVGFRGGLVAVGMDGLRLTIWTSDDGRTWSRVPDGPWAGAPRRVPRDEYFLHVHGVGTRNGRIVVHGVYGAAGDNELFPRKWRSTDGRRWTATERRGAAATGTDDRGYVGLVEMRRWPRGLDCDVGAFEIVARSRDGIDWRRLRDSRLPCSNYAGLAYHEPTDTYFAAPSDGRLPTVIKSRGLRGWKNVELDPSLFGHPRVEWRTESIVADGGLIVIAGSTSRDVMWTLISADGETWELSTGWPAMFESGAPIDIAIRHGRIVMATDWRVSRGWATDAVAPGPPLEAQRIDDCDDLDRASCLAIEAAVLDRLPDAAVGDIEIVGSHVCPLVRIGCSRPRRTRDHRLVAGVHVSVPGSPVRIPGNVWLTRANGTGEPRFDVVAPWGVDGRLRRFLP